MEIREITNVIEQAAPLSLQESYDNSGLIVGHPSAQVESALICVDITEAVMEEAIRLGVGLVISHHPIIFYPLKNITGSSYVERVVETAIKNNIALYASHTNLDATPGGMSWRLGNLLGLKNVILLGSAQGAGSDAGYGVAGEPEFETSTGDYLLHIKKSLGLEVIRYSEITRPTVRKVALCTGAGSSMIVDAKGIGADIYISSDFKYNDFLNADRELVIADVGHFESEYCAIDLLYDIITKKIPTFALHKSRESTNPVKYLK